MRNGKLNDQRCLLLLLALTVFIVFLGLAAKPAYADNPEPGPNPMFWQGGGEGGGGGPSLPPNLIEGYVWKNSPRSLAGPGLTVYLYVAGQTVETTTEANGYFRFQGSYIDPNCGYMVSVNGIRDHLGYYTDDMHWGQWRGFIQTNSLAYGFRHIYLEASAIVNVPAAALFSNTEYATLYYGTQTSSGFSHSLSFSVPIIGASVGYKTSESVTYTALFWSSPNHAQYINRPYYAPTYFDDALGNIVSGVAQAVEYSDWGGLTTDEYLDKNNLPTSEYVDFPVPPGGKDWTYQEQGSTTWSADCNVPFAILYQAFGKVIKLDIVVTKTSGATTWVRYRIENPTQNDMYFRVYTRGSHPDLNNGIGGMELHVWQI